MTIDEKINKLAECIAGLTVSVIPIIGADVANLIGEALNEIIEQTLKAGPQKENSDENNVYNQS